MAMIERVARAISKAIEFDEGLTHYPYEDRKEAMDEVARAAIEAMHKPTAEMLTAGENGINSLAALPGHYAEFCWPAMIDTALKP